MFYADQVGVKTIYETLAKLHGKHGGNTLEPAPLLKELAESGKSFADFQK